MSQRSKRPSKNDECTSAGQFPPSKKQRKSRYSVAEEEETKPTGAALNVSQNAPSTSSGKNVIGAPSAWQPRPLNDLKISSIYNRSATEPPAELFRKDLISAMKLPDSEPLSFDEYWIITDQWKQEWERGVQVPVNPDSLPEPRVRILENSIKYRMSYDFRLPKSKYVRISNDERISMDDYQLSNVAARAEVACQYDMDEHDAAWLEITNVERAQFGSSPISHDQFERVMEELEVRCYDRIQKVIKEEEGAGLEYDENVICDVCRSPDSEEGNEMVFCDNCNICVHQACYGITNIPSGQWLCRTCDLDKRPDCVLCPNKGGAMKSTKSGQKWAHVSCALWIPEVSIGCVEKMEPITKISSIPNSRWSLNCVLCRARVGACIQCSIKTCKIAYHVTCAFKHGLEMRAIIEDENADDGVKLRSYCQKHGTPSNNNKKEKSVCSGSEEDDSRRKKRKEMTSEEKNQVRIARLNEIETEFWKYVKIDDVNIQACGVDRECAQSIYYYWKLKRHQQHNKPLLVPKSDDVDLLSHKQEQADIEKMSFFLAVRHDLERVRNLCYMVNRREKLSRSYFKMREQTFHKQVAVLESSGGNLPHAVHSAVLEANHGPSIYDRLYSHTNVKPNVNLNFDDIVSILEGPKQDDRLNGLAKNERDDIPFNRKYLNGSSKRRSLYGSSYSSNTDSDTDSKMKLSLKKPIHFGTDREKVASTATSVRKRSSTIAPKVTEIAVSRGAPKRRGRPPLHSRVKVQSSSEDELPTISSKTKSRLKQIEREISEKASGSDDSDELTLPIPSGKDSQTKKMAAIYSDSDSESTEKDDITESMANNSDSQQQPLRTKAAVKEFNTQSKTANANNGKQQSKMGPDTDIVKIKIPPMRNKPSDLIVPQRQAAKKATENLKYTTTIARVKEPTENDAVQKSQTILTTAIPNAASPPERDDVSKTQKSKGRPRIKEIKKMADTGKTTERISKVDILGEDKEKEQDMLAYVPQRQAAKKAAEHIKSGLGSKPGIPGLSVVDNEKDASKITKKDDDHSKVVSKKEDAATKGKSEIIPEKKTKIIVSSSSSSSASSSSDSNSTSSSDSDSDTSKSDATRSKTKDCNKTAPDRPFLDKDAKSKATFEESTSSSSSSTSTDSSSSDSSDSESEKPSIKSTKENVTKSSDKAAESSPKTTTAKPNRKNSITKQSTSPRVDTSKVHNSKKPQVKVLAEDEPLLDKKYTPSDARSKDNRQSKIISEREESSRSETRSRSKRASQSPRAKQSNTSSGKSEEPARKSRDSSSSDSNPSLERPSINSKPKMESSSRKRKSVTSELSDITSEHKEQFEEKSFKPNIVSPSSKKPDSKQLSNKKLKEALIPSSNVEQELQDRESMLEQRSENQPKGNIQKVHEIKVEKIDDAKSPEIKHLKKHDENIINLKTVDQFAEKHLPTVSPTVLEEVSMAIEMPSSQKNVNADRIISNKKENVKETSRTSLSDQRKLKTPNSGKNDISDYNNQNNYISDSNMATDLKQYAPVSIRSRSIFSPPQSVASKENNGDSLFDFEHDMLSIENNPNNDDNYIGREMEEMNKQANTMLPQFPPYQNDLMFKEDSKEDSARETLNLVEKLRLKLSSKSNDIPATPTQYTEEKDEAITSETNNKQQSIFENSYCVPEINKLPEPPPANQSDDHDEIPDLSNALNKIDWQPKDQLHRFDNISNQSLNTTHLSQLQNGPTDKMDFIRFQHSDYPIQEQINRSELEQQLQAFTASEKQRMFSQFDELIMAKQSQMGQVGINNLFHEKPIENKHEDLKVNNLLSSRIELEKNNLLHIPNYQTGDKHFGKNAQNISVSTTLAVNSCNNTNVDSCKPVPMDIDTDINIDHSQIDSNHDNSQHVPSHASTGSMRSTVPSPYQDVNSRTKWNEADMLPPVRRSPTPSPASTPSRRLVDDNDLSKKSDLLMTPRAGLPPTNQQDLMYSMLQYSFSQLSSALGQQTLPPPPHHATFSQDLASQFTTGQKSAYPSDMSFPQTLGPVSLFGPNLPQNTTSLAQLPFPSPGGAAAMFPSTFAPSVPYSVSVMNKSDDLSTAPHFNTSVPPISSATSTSHAVNNLPQTAAVVPVVSSSLEAKKITAATPISSPNNTLQSNTVHKTQINTSSITNSDSILMSVENQQPAVKTVESRISSPIVESKNLDVNSTPSSVRSPSPITEKSNITFVGKKSPSKPTRASARVINQTKSPGKSPGKSPRQIEPTLTAKSGQTNKNRDKRSQANSARNSHRGRSKSGVNRGAMKNHYNFVDNNDYNAKLAGTVYDLDFDEDIAGESMENLRAMRERRKSTDVHVERKDSYHSTRASDHEVSPRYSSSNHSQSKQSSRSSSYIADLRELKPPSPIEETIDEPTAAVRSPSPPTPAFTDIVQPVLPGPVDMRTYSSGTYEHPTASDAFASHQQLLGAFASGTVDHPVPDNIDEDYEKELHSALAASTVREEQKPQSPPVTKIMSPVIVAQETPVKAISESRNQLKVKIKGPFLDANYPSTAPTISSQPTIVEPSTPSNTSYLSNASTMSSGGPPSCFDTTPTGTSNLRRMRKKELLRQYWNQDMNLNEPNITAPVAVAPAAPISRMGHYGIPKAVASIVGIPTKDDYKGVFETANAPPEKKRKKEKSSGTSRELRELGVKLGEEYAFMHDMFSEGRRSVSSVGSNISGTAEDFKASRRLTRPNKPPAAASRPNNNTPIKIKINKINVGNATMENTSRIVTETHTVSSIDEKCKQPPKKRLIVQDVTPIPMHFEDIRRESMDFRKRVMDEFGKEKRVKKSKKNKKDKDRSKKKKDKYASLVQVINCNDGAPKLIIRLGPKKHDEVKSPKLALTSSKLKATEKEGKKSSSKKRSRSGEKHRNKTNALAKSLPECQVQIQQLPNKIKATGTCTINADFSSINSIRTLTSTIAPKTGSSVAALRNIRPKKLAEKTKSPIKLKIARREEGYVAKSVYSDTSKSSDSGSGKTGEKNKNTNSVKTDDGVNKNVNNVKTNDSVYSDKELSTNTSNTCTVSTANSNTSSTTTVNVQSNLTDKVCVNISDTTTADSYTSNDNKTISVSKTNNNNNSINSCASNSESVTPDDGKVNEATLSILSTSCTLPSSNLVVDNSSGRHDSNVSNNNNNSNATTLTSSALSKDCQVR